MAERIISGVRWLAMWVGVSLAEFTADGGDLWLVGGVGAITCAAWIVVEAWDRLRFQAGVREMRAETARLFSPAELAALIARQDRESARLRAWMEQEEAQRYPWLNAPQPPVK